MKKICYFTISILMIFILFCMPVNAANEFEFELNYTGDVVLNETKDASVILRGNNATTYAKVRVKIEVSGPSTPKIIATDSLNQEIDIAQTGYWGPDEGFAVSGTFENETPVKVTFTAVGTYTIKLSLVNVEGGETEIISDTFTIEVLEDASNTNEVIEPENTIENNTIEKLPQTGTSVAEYILYATITLLIIGFIYYRTRMLKK